MYIDSIIILLLFFNFGIPLSIFASHLWSLPHELVLTKQEHETRCIIKIYCLKNFQSVTMMYERADSTPATSRSDSLAFPNSIITAVVIPFLLFQFWSFGTVGHVITPAAQLPAPLPSAAYGSILGGDDLLLDGQPMNWLGKRAVETCDEIGLCMSTLLHPFCNGLFCKQKQQRKPNYEQK